MNYTNSLLQWFGGKKYLLKNLLPFPEHRYYYEVFGGSSVVLLNKIKSNFELLNDINKRCVNLWKVIQKHWIELESLCNKQITSRQLFEEYRDEESKNEIENAMQFFYINQFAMIGKNIDYLGLTDKINREFSIFQTFERKIERIKKLHERIKLVNFESVDFRNILKRLLKRRDFENTLIYLDPPYYVGGEEYENQTGNDSTWGKQEFNDLWELVNQFKNAKIIISIDNRLEEELKGKWDRTEIIRTTPSSKHQKQMIEYIIRNYDKKEIPVMKKFKYKKLL